MTAQDYIQSKLDELNKPVDLEKPIDNDELVEAIFRILMSKKFRKYSANDVLIAHIRNAIRINIERNEPINITFLHGAYKLWRLEESPEADWAELFALMHYTKWLKSVCEIYEPGVGLDLFVDDLIVPRLGTASTNEVDSYLKSYQKLVDFLHAYQPNNFRMTITTVGSRFSSPEAFASSLEESIKQKRQEIPNGLPVLSESDKARVELNTNVTEDQLKDPQWKEKVALIETAYSRTKAEPGYHKASNKILAFTNSIPGVAIAVGSTKDSVGKFWVGVGALKPVEGSYRQVILTPKQLNASNSHWEDVSLKINGKNFMRIRVLNS